MFVSMDLTFVEDPMTIQGEDTLDNPKWKVAMVEEMKALQKNDTWELVELPKGKKTIVASRSDYTLFLNHAFEGNIIALIMYVDDIVVTDIEVARSKLGIFDSIFDLLDETGMLACKPVDTPIELNHKLAKSGAMHQTSQNGQISSIGAAESPILQIITCRLNGQNFLLWSQSVKLFIRGRGKIDYLNGTKQAPKFDDPTYHVWDVENSMILSWLVNSMESKIGQTYMYLKTAKLPWNVVVEELGLFYDLEWSCAEDSAQYQRIVKKDCLMEFLAGLKRGFG
ncbi:hypothetical protein CK203_039747 [Vitis vinifera]|uniref:Retrotransposon Copia-like N-terminal domain-containing protein n=1 Tax=Vitis vinifera TaxID=29760 RepID=A0A438HTW3_VITVI|nr:hypothetical protein CK203_039747 [Vitis vinifera]